MRYLTFIFSLLLFINHSHAQNSKQIQKMDAKVWQKMDAAEKTLLRDFVAAMEDYRWEKLKPLILPEHFQMQFELYSNDEVMFSDLGEVGKRDSSAIIRLYVRETLGLSQMDADDLIPKGSHIKNLFDLNEFEQIKKLQFLSSKVVGDIKIFYYIVRTADGQQYKGKIMVIDSLTEGLRLVGAVG